MEIKQIAQRHKCNKIMEIKIMETVLKDDKTAWTIYCICKKCKVVLMSSLFIQIDKPVEDRDFMFVDEIAKETKEHPMSKLKEEEYKKKLSPVDGTPIFSMLKAVKSKEEGKVLLNHLNKGFEDAGKIGLERAYMDGLLTKKEFKNYWEKELHIDTADIAPILQAYYNEKDDLIPSKGGIPNPGKKDELVVVTSPTSHINKHRKIIKEKFNVKVIDVIEALEMIKKADPEGYAEVEKRVKNENKNMQDT